ncbi:cell envelope integrity protein TolA [Allorhizobium sp. BGMRC 0089]|uniref:cell envelope integrity protein TolA n=1 Tax=Allorhizobium sonneratiae TaxID=2934936 RepID=UPI0020347C39|nr:cell envelope integrity protein TolA [Allorhizobium sonneratiae]MCM2290919.1 cell envelope integrity protein TolA [Allorhizobium sonneratiae]
MKGSLVTSAILHGVVLALALLTLSAPAPMQVADVEALPVDLVPISELTQIQQGDKKAPKREKSAPTPTKKPATVPNAENLGDNQMDLKTPPTPNKRPVQDDVAAAPEKVDQVKPNPDNENNDVKDIAKEETAIAPSKDTVPVPKDVPIPTTEPKPAPAPAAKPDAKAEAKPEDKPQDAPKQDDTPLPSSVPLPAVRPTPPKPEETKKPDPKPKPEEKPKTEEAKAPNVKKADHNQKMAKSKASKESDFNADEIAALLNKTDAAGGGAKRSTDQAALGGKKTTQGSTLSQSEIDALRGQIQNNWYIIPGTQLQQGATITARFHLDESGNLVGEPTITANGISGSTKTMLEDSARRAILKSAPFKNLPRDKYDAWSEVEVTFDPSEFME